ncbi:MAG TPA: SBBP repeat-containing protein [Bryobacteraceae bacterium]|nr:SBBP repeat-containing protein [Bryobacteraceae bacterium]
MGWATYLGGAGTDVATTVAVDTGGNAYVAGYTVANGVFTAFITKVNASGTAVLFTKSISVHGSSTPTGIALDPEGNIYVTGTTDAPDFPTTPGAFQTSGSGFVMKLSNAGDRVIYSTLVHAAPSAIAVDSSGASYVTGTAGSDFPSTPGAYQPKPGGGLCPGPFPHDPSSPCPDGFVLKLNPTGTGVVYATFLGGSDQERGQAIAVDGSGAAYVTGTTASADFPVTSNAVERTFHGRIDLGPLWFGDAFAAKIDPSGSRLEWATYLGGSGADTGGAIAVDHNSNAYVAGLTQSADFPTTPGVFRRTYEGEAGAEPGSFQDGFVIKISANGAAAYATYFSGTNAIAVDATGNAYLDPPGSAAPCSTRDPSIQVLSADGTHLIVPANFSGPGYAGSSTVALDGAGNAYFAGLTRRLVFFATPGAFQTSYGGGDSDAFVAKASFTAAPTPRFIGCILNAASLLAGNTSFFPDGAVSPGEVVSLFGNDIGPANPLAGQGNPGGSLSTMLGDTQVLFDGVPAPLLYAGTSQINAVVPFEVRKTTSVVLRRGGADTGPISLPVAEAVPGIFTIDGTGTGEAAVVNTNGTINSAANPAPRGSVITFYATGLGAMDPPGIDGSTMPLSLPLPKPHFGTSAALGSKAATIEYAGAAPGIVAGVFQVNIRIAADSDTGPAVPLNLYVGNYVTQQTALLNLPPVTVAIGP